MSLGPFLSVHFPNRIRVEQRRQTSLSIRLTPAHSLGPWLTPSWTVTAHLIHHLQSASFSQKLSLKCVTDSSGQEDCRGSTKSGKWGQIGSMFVMSCVCQHGRWGGVGGGPLKDTSARLQGWTEYFPPRVLGAHEWHGWRSLMTPALCCTIAKAMRHCLQSPKSRGRAAAQPGTAWVLWELSDMGRGWWPSQGSSPRKTVCPHGTWGILWFVLRQMRGDTQQTFRKGFETSLLGESWLTNAYSFFNWQTHRAPTALGMELLGQALRAQMWRPGFETEPTYYLGQVT